MRYTLSLGIPTSLEDDIAFDLAPLVVASVPAGHPYVRAITDPARVTVLPDPPVPGASDGRWWPPQVLTSRWLRRHARDVDVMHVHFGLESFTPEELAGALHSLRGARRPLVFTVHDLENPQLREQGDYLRLLDEIVPVADELITLTEPAALEVQRRWGRTASVIAHPSLLGASGGQGDLPTGTGGRARRIGVHLRDLRPNIDGLGTAQTLVQAVAAMRARGTETEAVVRLNARVRDEGQAAAIADLAAAAPGVVLERGDRLDDDALCAWIADLDVCLLPYIHGTHSGWVELCFDLAVPVAGPRVGHVEAQHPSDFHPFAIGDPLSLEEAVTAASGPAWSRPGSAARAHEVSARAAERAGELRRVREAHLAVYRRAVGTRVAA